MDLLRSGITASFSIMKIALLLLSAFHSCNQTASVNEHLSVRQLALANSAFYSHKHDCGLLYPNTIYWSFFFLTYQQPEKNMKEGHIHKLTGLGLHPVTTIFLANQNHEHIQTLMPLIEVVLVFKIHQQLKTITTIIVLFFHFTGCGLPA